MQDIEHLVKMANQIADNFSFHADAAERTADHLRRFWAPSMRERLVEYVAAGGEGLQPVLQRALRHLAEA